jgi:hypothetical protein
MIRGGEDEGEGPIISRVFGSVLEYIDEYKATDLKVGENISKEDAEFFAQDVFQIMRRIKRAGLHPQ